ncbi:D-2-hydroxyacid dehydrogenase [Oceanobacillus luteolus]|uniref:D-2-hydroxyacid dehydrogenase n=1 Tax=Oceanobacillus luteolus TaxID=1274358 RepID=A0ABW4HXI2_9BACI|nr:D-2-hydroxyacid dehydrogenase [Oceanobacillus luteolus]MCM3741190.1 D-2-hydroxyacid dehydrogenase [Oceanobacillus luteolus]
MSKAVILDGYTLNPGDLDWKPLQELADFEIYDRTTYSIEEAPLIIERAKDAEVILTNKTPLTKEILDELPMLKYIGVLATGYNVVDVEAAKERNITVTNIPSYGTDTVAQAAIALLLELCHRTGDHSNAVKNGEWTNSPDFCFWNHPIIELSGKTMGIIGYGQIGQTTSRIAQAFGMKVLAYNRTREKVIETESVRYATLEELYREADVIMLHCPLTEENEGFINKESIEQMKDSVLIVNNARGALINEADLADALNRGKVAGAGLDVVSEEPISEDNPLLKAKNCIITPHIAWASLEARQRLLDIAVENLSKYLEGNPINVVNQ